jgi:hypothetical protein
LLVLLILLAFLIPRVISSAAEITDPFAYSEASLAAVIAAQGRALLNPFQSVDYWTSHANSISDKMVAPVLLVTLSETTSIPIASLIHFPVGGVAFVLLAYALALALTRSRVIALMYASVMTFDPEIIRATNGLFYITIGYSLLLLFLTLYLRVRTRGNMILLILTYFALVFSYYAAEIAALMFVICLFLVATVSVRIGIEHRQQKDTYFLLLTLVFTGAFEALVYGYWRTYYNFDRGVNVLVGFFQYLFGVSMRSPEAVSSYVAGTRAPQTLWILYLVQLAAIFAGVILYAVTRTFGSARVSLAERRNTTVFLAVILMIAGYLWLYAFAGELNLRMFLMLGPIFLFMALAYSWHGRGVSSRNITKYLATFLVLILIIAPVIRYTGSFADTTTPYAPGRYSAAAPSLIFMIEHTDAKRTTRAVSDLAISGELMFFAIELNRTNIRSYPFLDNYKMLYSSDPSVVTATMRERSFTWLLLTRDFETRTIDAYGWGWYPPASNAVSHASNSTLLNVVYADGNTVIFLRNQF